LATDNMVACALVPSDRYLVDGGLFSLVNAHLHIDGITCNGHLVIIYPEEQVAVVHIQTTDIRAFRIESFLPLQQLPVIHIAFLDSKNRVKGTFGVEQIAGPLNIP